MHPADFLLMNVSHYLFAQQYQHTDDEYKGYIIWKVQNTSQNEFHSFFLADVAHIIATIVPSICCKDSLWYTTIWCLLCHFSSPFFHNSVFVSVGKVSGNLVLPYPID